MSSYFLLKWGVQIPYIFHENQTPRSLVQFRTFRTLSCPQILEPRSYCRGDASCVAFHVVFAPNTTSCAAGHCYSHAAPLGALVLNPDAILYDKRNNGTAATSAAATSAAATTSGTGTATAAGAGAHAAAAAAAGGVEQTVAALLAKMSVPEKAAQLDIWRTADILTNGPSFSSLFSY